MNHKYAKIIRDAYDINYGQKKRRHVKNIQGTQTLIPAQGKIILLPPKIIHGSLINHTYTKIIPDICDIIYK